MRGRQPPGPPPTLHARRLDALWKAGSNPALSDAQRIQTFLTLAALSLRPGHPFTVRVERQDGDELVLEAGVDADAAPLTAGTRAPLVRGTRTELLRTGVVGTWFDIRRKPDIARSPEIEAEGWQAVAGIAFSACASTFTLTFTSPQALASDLESDDRDFIELLATTLAERLQQRWRLQRIEAYEQARVPGE